MTDILEPPAVTERPRGGMMLTDSEATAAERARPSTSRFDTEAARAGLTQWLSGYSPEHTITDVHLAEGNGWSSETILFSTVGPDGTTRDLVARIAPAAVAMPVFRDYDLAGQAAVMRHVVAHTDLPVPMVLDVHDSPDLLGMPFFVMNRLSGSPLEDMPPYTFEGWLLTADDDARAAFRDECVDVVAGVHSVPVTADVARAVNADGPMSAEDALTAMLRRDREYYDWAREGGPRSPLIERALDWLEANRPTESGDAVLNWGDSRPANILFSPEHTVTGVVDWEMAMLAPRGADLGWMIFFHEFFQFLAEAFEMPGVPGLFDIDAVAARYSELTGVAPENLAYHRTVAAVRHAVIMYRIAMRSIVYGGDQMPEDPDQLIIHRPQLEALID